MKTIAAMTFLIASSAFAYEGMKSDAAKNAEALKEKTAGIKNANICFVCEDTQPSADGICKNKKNLDVADKATCNAANGIWATNPVSKATGKK